MVVDAVHASMSVPWLFQPVTIDGNQYIDGSIASALAVKSIPKNIRPENVLICILRPKNKQYGVLKPLSYLLRLLNTIISNKSLCDSISHMYPYVIKFEDIPVSPLPIKISKYNISLSIHPDAIDACFSIGYSTMFAKMKEFSTTS